MKAKPIRTKWFCVTAYHKHENIWKDIIFFFSFFICQTNNTAAVNSINKYPLAFSTSKYVVTHQHFFQSTRKAKEATDLPIQFHKLTWWRHVYKNLQKATTFHISTNNKNNYTVSQKTSHPFYILNNSGEK